MAVDGNNEAVSLRSQCPTGQIDRLLFGMSSVRQAGEEQVGDRRRSEEGDKRSSMEVPSHDVNDFTAHWLQQSVGPFG